MCAGGNNDKDANKGLSGGRIIGRGNDECTISNNLHGVDLAEIIHVAENVMNRFIIMPHCSEQFLVGLLFVAMQCLPFSGNNAFLIYNFQAFPSRRIMGKSMERKRMNKIKE